jgi:hypothetical protein
VRVEVARAAFRLGLNAARAGQCRIRRARRPERLRRRRGVILLLVYALGAQETKQRNDRSGPTTKIKEAT